MYFSLPGGGEGDIKKVVLTEEFHYIQLFVFTFEFLRERSRASYDDVTDGVDEVLDTQEESFYLCKQDPGTAARCRPQTGLF